MVCRGKVFLAGLALAVGCAAAASADAQGTPTPLLELIARAKAQVTTIDLETFRRELDNRSTGILIDVREPEEFRGGHIPGAINIPRGQIELNIWPRVGFPDRLDMGAKITLYCGSGVRCLLAAKSLQDLGFTNVVAVDMRLADWGKAGYPLVTD